MLDQENVKNLYSPAFASARKLRANDLIEEFGSSEVASTIRKSALGSIASIGAFYAKMIQM